MSTRRFLLTTFVFLIFGMNVARSATLQIGFPVAGAGAPLQSPEYRVLLDGDAIGYLPIAIVLPNDGTPHRLEIVGVREFGSLIMPIFAGAGGAVTVGAAVPQGCLTYTFGASTSAMAGGAINVSLTTTPVSANCPTMSPATGVPSNTAPLKFVTTAGSGTLFYPDPTGLVKTSVPPGVLIVRFDGFTQDDAFIKTPGFFDCRLRLKYHVGPGGPWVDANGVRVDLVIGPPSNAAQVSCAAQKIP